MNGYNLSLVECFWKIIVPYAKIVYVGNSISYDVSFILIVLPSRPFRPRVRIFFSCNKALYASYIATGRMVKVQFGISDSQNRLKMFKSFEYDYCL